MGICDSKHIFSEQELNDYKSLTYLTEKEIYRCHEDFGKLAGFTDKEDVNKIKDARIDFQSFKNKSNKFSNNPFVVRIFQVFSQDNLMSFEDYLNLMSVFSEAAPSIIKCLYAFDIYNFENREYLRKNDVRNLIKILTGNKISKKDLNNIVDKVFAEADFYDNQKITIDEFEHIVSNSTEFARMSSTYAKRMAQLSARIFGQILFSDKNSPNARLVKRFAQKPIQKMNEFSMDYYPRHQEHDHMFKMLRYHGLYRDEHVDFKEEIERLKKLRGKGKRERKPRTEEPAKK